MRSHQATDLAVKIDELRAVFVLGQRALPFFEEVLAFLREISPLIENINVSLQEQAGQLPQATSKLRSVTEATELATTEVLDLVDRSLLGLGLLRERDARTRERAESLGALDARLIRVLRPALADRPEVLEEVERIHAEKLALRRAVAADTEATTLDEIRDYMGRIMISLQVQDITAQQIAGVHHLLESVRARMSRLAHEISADGFGLDAYLAEAAAPYGAPAYTPAPPPGYHPAYPAPEAAYAPEGYAQDGYQFAAGYQEQAYVTHTPDGPVAFDPNAVYDGGGDRQAMADQVAAAFAGGLGFAPAAPGFAPAAPAFAPAAPAGPPSAADIDALFRQGAAVGDGAPAPAAGAPAMGGNAPASQADIDALFGAR